VSRKKERPVHWKRRLTQHENKGRVPSSKGQEPGPIGEEKKEQRWAGIGEKRTINTAPKAPHGASRPTASAVKKGTPRWGCRVMVARPRSAPETAVRGEMTRRETGDKQPVRREETRGSSRRKGPTSPSRKVRRPCRGEKCFTEGAEMKGLKRSKKRELQSIVSRSGG